MLWANLLHIYQPPFQKRKIIDKVVRESYGRILFVLEALPKVKISLNICASLTEQLLKCGHQKILNRIKRLANRGQIELVGSAKYHPILPFLPKSEVIRQVKLNEALNQKCFGEIWRPRPKGFFLPELAYDQKTAKIIQNLGYEWIVLDEIAYQGRFGRVLFDRSYEIKGLFPNQEKKKLKVIFRNRGLSLLFFGQWLDSLSPVQNSSDQLGQASFPKDRGMDKFFSAIKKDKRSDRFLVTSFDGENLGHHHKYLIEIWREILNQPGIQTVTYSEYLKFLPTRPVIEVEPLISTWSTEVKDLKEDIPYPLWRHPRNQVHQWQWRLTDTLLRIMKSCQKDANYKKARNLFDRALASDQYWWASANPWWSPGIIKRGTRDFVQISQLLEKSLNPGSKNRVIKIARDIFNELERRKSLEKIK